MPNPIDGELTESELRLEALRLANSHRVVSGNGLGYSPGPSADEIVARAEAYADFLLCNDKGDSGGN